MVERLPYKQNVNGSSPFIPKLRVLHNGSALAFQARGAGSIPATR